MAYDMVFSGAPDQEGEVETFFLCSTGAWEQVRAWAASVDAPALQALAEDGEFLGTDELSRELSALSPPEDGGVKATLEALVEKMGVGDPDETIAISDGDEGEDTDLAESSEERLKRAAAILFEDYP